MTPIPYQQIGTFVEQFGDVQFGDGTTGASAFFLTQFDDDGGAIILFGQPTGGANGSFKSLDLVSA